MASGLFDRKDIKSRAVRHDVFAVGRRGRGPRLRRALDRDPRRPPRRREGRALRGGDGRPPPRLSEARRRGTRRGLRRGPGPPPRELPEGAGPGGVTRGTLREDARIRSRGGMPPYSTAAVPHVTAVTRAVSIGAPVTSAWTSPAAKTSPAPVLSTATTSRAGTWRRRLSECASAPPGPRVTTIQPSDLARGPAPRLPRREPLVIGEIGTGRDEDVRGPRAGRRRRNVRHDEGPVEPLGQDPAQVQLAAPDVDHVGRKRAKAARRAVLAAAVEVHDGPFALRVRQDEGARARARRGASPATCRCPPRRGGRGSWSPPGPSRRRKRP